MRVTIAVDVAEGPAAAPVRAVEIELAFHPDLSADLVAPAVAALVSAQAVQWFRARAPEKLSEDRRAVLEQIADFYRATWQAGDPHPTKAVAERFGLGRNVAAKRVAQARRAGLLPATQRRRPGLGANREG